jgi:hypothetical protein
MKLRLDLLEHLTADDIRQAAEESVHRFKPEPNFSKTGVGYLRPATPEERQQEIARSEALIERLKKRQREAKQNDSGNVTSS